MGTTFFKNCRELTLGSVWYILTVCYSEGSCRPEMEEKYYSYRYNAWFGSIVSQAKILCEHKGLFPTLYYDFMYRDDKRTAIALEDCPEGYGSCIEDAVRLVKALGRARLIPAYRPTAEGYALNFSEGKFLVNGAEYSETDFVDFFKKLGREYVLTEYFAPCAQGVKNVLILSRSEPGGIVCEPCGAFVSFDGGFEPLDPADCTELLSAAKRIAGYLAFFEFLQFKFVPCGDGYKLIDVSTRLSLPEGYEADERLARFIADWDNAHENPEPEHTEIERSEREFNEKWSKTAATEHRSGMRPYMASMWDEELAADMADKSVSDTERQWAYERGFFGYRVKELGLNEENYTRYIPDYDYFWVNRINPEYQLWISDKLASRFALGSFKSVLPEYYYAVAKINGKSRILPMPELPAGYELSYDSIFALLREKGLLAIKKTYGSHGQGFNKLEYRDGKYILNGKSMSPDSIVSELFSAEGVNLVTEYVIMHEWFRAFYPEALNTVRVNCFRRTESEPEIGACFMKLGHSKGGFTDNINTAEGGIIISLDKTDGRIIEPEFKSGDHYTACPVHPDTGTVIEGNVPHWDMILDGVKAVCRSLPQLQYFGFDVAVTPTGYKIIEVNVFPDYTKYLLMDGKTQEFLAEKVRQKFRHYRIDLPERYRSAQDGEQSQHRFKFSIVIPNESAAEGFIGQTMGFKENVQLILTGGNAAELCALYPNNIVTAQDNNAALSVAEGKYIAFTDTGDVWPSDALIRVWDFFEANGDKTDVVACRQKWTGDRTGWIKLDYKFSKGSGVLDIAQCPDCIQTSLCSVFMRTDAAKKQSFNASLPVLGGSLFINELILQKGTLGLLREVSCTRHFANAPEHEADDTKLIEAYCEHLFGLSERLRGKVLPYIQYLVMDELRVLAVSDKAQLCDTLIAMLHRVEPSVIATLKNCSLGTKGALLRMRDGKRFAESLRIDGEEVFADPYSIGKLNAASALTLLSVDTGSRYIIKGRVLLPGFMIRPEIYLADAESGRQLACVELTAIPEDKYRCLDGGYSYISYEFALAVRGSRLSRQNRFMLKTDTKPVKLSVNLLKDSSLVGMRRDGELCVKKRSMADKLKAKFK